MGYEIDIIVINYIYTKKSLANESKAISLNSLNNFVFPKNRNNFPKKLILSR